MDDYEQSTKDANSAAEIAMRTATRTNKSRLEIGAEMLNLFNRAVQVQGNRNYWTAGDYRTFMIAIAAIDNIGQQTISDIEQERVAAEIAEHAPSQEIQQLLRKAAEIDKPKAAEIDKPVNPQTSDLTSRKTKLPDLKM